MGIWVIETIKLLFGCVVSFVLGFVVGFVYLVIVLGCAVYIKGRLFADVLKECETLEREELDDEEYGDEVPSILKRRDVERSNTAFSKISDPSLKIFEPKDRYYGKDVIDKIYGSGKKVYDSFETKYYESENIRRREAAAEKTRSCAPGKGPTWTCVKNVFKTIDLVESVAKDPTAFPTDNGDRSEAQGDDVSRQEQN